MRNCANGTSFIASYLVFLEKSVWHYNVDVNPKANLNKSSYHGTSLSMTQFRSNNDEGQEFPPIPSPGNISQDS